MAADPNIVQIIFKKGTTAQNNTYLGISGEITIDVTKKTLRVHDGVSIGGFELVSASGASGTFAPIVHDHASITGNAATASRWASARSILVQGDASGVVNIDGSQDVTLNLTVGNATRAQALLTARTIGLTGDATGSVSFDGTQNVAIGTTLASTAVTPGTYGSATKTVAFTVDSKGRLTAASQADLTVPFSAVTGTPTTVAGYGITDALSNADVVTVAAPNKILKLDSNSKLPASITGSAVTLANAREFSITGDGTAPAVSFTGAAAVALALTLAATGVTAQAYGSQSQIPVLTIDAKGRITAAVNENIAAPWSGVTGKPTTIAGYGITDALTASLIGVPSGLAPLGSDGKIAASYLSAIALTETFAVSSQAEMLALTAQIGDIAIRSDLSRTFVLSAEPASTLNNWKELLSPTAGVISVNGLTGAVTIGYADVGAAPAAHDHASITGNAATATKLATARTISLTGGVTGSNTFDGSGNMAIACTVATVAASAVTQNSTNRFVTDAQISDWNSRAAGDHTHSNATSGAAGFLSTADKIKLDTLTATPSATSIIEDSSHRFVTDAQIAAWNAAAGGGSTVDLIVGDGTSDLILYNSAERFNFIAGTNVSLSFNNTTNSLTINSTASGGVSSWNDLTDKPTTIAGFAITDAYTKSEVDTSLAGKANSSHTHTIANVTGLQAALDDKLDVGSTFEISDINGLTTALAGKSNTGHTHAIADVVNLQTTLDGKSGTGHGHVISDVSGLQAALDAKVASSLLGAANGVATLGSDGKLTASQVPSGGGGGGSLAEVAAAKLYARKIFKGL